MNAFTIGAWLITKYQRIAGERGVLHAAKLMRKQGFPVELAVAALARKS